MRSTPKKPTKPSGSSAPKKRAAEAAPVVKTYAQRKAQASKEALAKEIGKMAEDLKASRRRDAMDPWEIFLEAIRKLPDRGSACLAAGLGRREVSDRLRIDANFEKEFKRAFDDGLDSMEDEVVRRAVLGVEEPVYQGGLLVGTKTKYSDTLLMFFLEASRKKFRSGDAEARRPLSDEAKNTMRQIFQEVVDDTELSTPTKPAAKKRGRPTGGSR